MSLWKVDDAATQQLMTAFYSGWIKLGNKQKAFKQAQLQLMTKYKDPYYWGAFVMMGQ
jgi:CHAT domain-containing protein